MFATLLTSVPDWFIVGVLAGNECLLMIVLALLYWRKNARERSRDQGRVRGYILGTSGLLAGLVVWAAVTAGPVAPSATPLVFAALLAGAGAGAILPRVILFAHDRADVRAAAADEEAARA